MKEKLFAIIVGLVLENLTSQQVKKWADMGLDFLEEKAKETSNPIDDALLKVIRKAFQIPEFDT